MAEQLPVGGDKLQIAIYVYSKLSLEVITSSPGYLGKHGCEMHNMIRYHACINQVFRLQCIGSPNKNT